MESWKPGNDSCPYVYTILDILCCLFAGYYKSRNPGTLPKISNQYSILTHQPRIYIYTLTYFHVWKVWMPPNKPNLGMFHKHSNSGLVGFRCGCQFSMRQKVAVWLLAQQKLGYHKAPDWSYDRSGSWSYPVSAQPLLSWCNRNGLVADVILHDWRSGIHSLYLGREDWLWQTPGRTTAPKWDGHGSGPAASRRIAMTCSAPLRTAVSFSSAGWLLWLPPSCCTRLTGSSVVPSVNADPILVKSQHCLRTK